MRADDVTINDKGITTYRWNLAAQAEILRLGCAPNLVFDDDLESALGTDEAWERGEDPAEWVAEFVKSLP